MQTNHQSDHPIEQLIQQTCTSPRSSTSLAILSPLVQLSFVFHLALAILRRQFIDSDHHPALNPSVMVIGSCSQSDFQQGMTEENDTFLLNGSANDELANLLNRIQFCFCLDFDQLLTILFDLSQPISDLPGMGHISSEKAPMLPVALIIIDLANYLNLLSSSPTLSDLTRLLGLISATQSQLTSKLKLNHALPIYLIDRIKHTQNWPISNSNPEETRSVEKVFRHFFQNTWNIETDDQGLSPSGAPSKYRLHSISSENSTSPNDQEITYQVLEELQSDHIQSIHNIINGPYRKTHVVLESSA